MKRFIFGFTKERGAKSMFFELFIVHKSSNFLRKTAQSYFLDFEILVAKFSIKNLFKSIPIAFSIQFHYNLHKE